MISKLARSALFLNGFRPFFLGGSAFAGLAVLFWVAVFSGWVVLPSGADPRNWHAHEMTFGFFGAIMGGFLLTAMPGWTGKAPLSGEKLFGLFVVWLAGRVAMTAYLIGDPAASFPVWAVAVAAADLIYPALLLVYCASQIVDSRGMHNLPVVVMVALYGLSDVLFHAAPYSFFDRNLGPHLALGAAALLIALIGGRIVPNFTRNWLAARSPGLVPAGFGLFDKLALVETAVAILAWTFVPDSVTTGFLLALAALLGLIRLSRWRGLHTAAEPLVMILHAGYLWLVLALAALAVNVLVPSLLPGASALHVLTAGSMGVMMLAVMTRATRGHTGRPLLADRTTVVIYALVNLGALVRVSAPVLPFDYAAAVAVGGILWSSAMLLFAVKYGPWLIGPRS